MGVMKHPNKELPAMSSTPISNAYVLLASGTSINLVDPDPWCWTDTDLAERASRTLRWAGSSKWPRAMSVAQHQLMTLAIRENRTPDLTHNDAAFELLHDAAEGFLGFDPITPVKKLLGSVMDSLEQPILRAIMERYGVDIPRGARWTLHKEADSVAAASEALHVVGWPLADIRHVLQIKHQMLDADPLFDNDAQQQGYQPWEPWEADYAAMRYLTRLREVAPALQVAMT